MAAGLIEAWLPRADFIARQSLLFASPPAAVYRAARARLLMGTPLAGFLLAVRALPARFDRRGSPETAGSLLVLAEDPPREVMLGFAGAFWHPSRNITPLANAAAWRAFSTPGMAKSAVSISVAAEGHDTRLSTETRVVCYGAHARRKFRLYWLFAGVGSALIRRAWLAAVKRDVEMQRTAKT